MEPQQNETEILDGDAMLLEESRAVGQRLARLYLVDALRWLDRRSPPPIFRVALAEGIATGTQQILEDSLLPWAKAEDTAAPEFSAPTLREDEDITTFATTGSWACGFPKRPSSAPDPAYLNVYQYAELSFAVLLEYFDEVPVSQRQMLLGVMIAAVKAVVSKAQDWANGEKSPWPSVLGISREEAMRIVETGVWPGQERGKNQNGKDVQ